MHSAIYVPIAKWLTLKGSCRIGLGNLVRLRTRARVIEHAEARPTTRVSNVDNSVHVNPLGYSALFFNSIGACGERVSAGDPIPLFRG